MKSVQWSDKLGHRSRSAFLLLIQNNNVYVFEGESIPSVCVVRGYDYTKNGKWSHNTYRIDVSNDVTVISGHMGWETGRFAEGLAESRNLPDSIDTWIDMAQALGVSMESAQNFLYSWRPKAAEAIDRIEKELQDLESTTGSSSIVVATFGSPTRRMREEGFWRNPKPIPGGGEVCLINPDEGWYPENIKICDRQGRVIRCDHKSGRGGGYVSITLAIED